MMELRLLTTLSNIFFTEFIKAINAKDADGFRHTQPTISNHITHYFTFPVPAASL